MERSEIGTTERVTRRMGSSTDPCSRCAGCGRLGGVGTGERPWSHFVGVPAHCLIPKVMGMQRPRTCPDCGGTGGGGSD
jgi:hypothetical protein